MQPGAADEGGAPPQVGGRPVGRATEAEMQQPRPTGMDPDRPRLVSGRQTSSATSKGMPGPKVVETDAFWM